MRTALQNGPVVLDGGLGTRLEARGNDVSSALWSAEILRQQPEEVRAAHQDFFEAGARVATTCSYQVSYSGFARVGVETDAVDELLARSIAVAQDARAASGLGPTEAWVMASVGPYGASLGDGSEYTGDYGLSAAELRDWHRRRLQVLAAAKPDALLCETIPSLAEVVALREALSDLATPAILSFTVADGRLRSGESLVDAVRIAESTPNILAIGVNCSAVADTDRALRIMREASELPLIAYPNSGEVWDANARSWLGSAQSLVAYVPEWLALGVKLIGGCCRVDTGELAEIAAAATRPRS
ncbi:homocysteine S-methyltransferase [Leucobacter coleopterorum]|uniref:Homocysteine S-methyltransferase n=1 Tax=Leucobacter coleopterorum TaxID=2714933 RepID=A0ABX6K0K4_9MICO|nr:homocysteine S-methyltransferase [Leucobacter coleopterorum]